MALSATYEYYTFKIDSRSCANKDNIGEIKNAVIQK